MFKAFEKSYNMKVVGIVSSMAVTTRSLSVISSSDHYNTCKVKRICRGLAGVHPSDG
jgi:hypothetical protein